ncbi:MAG: hypothetical protein U0794_22245 [Isosphaeraceae bacterium]
MVVLKLVGGIAGGVAADLDLAGPVDGGRVEDGEVADDVEILGQGERVSEGAVEGEVLDGAGEAGRVGAGDDELLGSVESGDRAGARE